MTRHAPVLAIMMGLLLETAQSSAEVTKSCPSGQIDALDWLTLDADLRSSKHMDGGHPLYTAMWPDKFWWIKTPTGDTWDILLYDNNYVYFWITGTSWGDPRAYSRHIANVPLTPRCATPGYPGVAIAIPDTRVDIYDNCSFVNRGDPGKGVTEVWGPYTAGNPGLDPRPPIGGDIPNNTTVYTFSWRWGCNNSYGNCHTKEEFIVAQRYGLVQWNAFSLVNGQYVLSGQTNFNLLRPGNVNPFFPCF